MYRYCGILKVMIFILFTLDSSAQHTVSGIISDKSDRTLLLPGVSVYIPEFNLFDISREGGTYILRNVGIGVVHIQYSLIGYKTIVKTINTRDSATVIPVELEPSLIELKEVSVSSNSSKLPNDMQAFSLELDNQMRQCNVYYDDLITGNILRTLKITSLKKNAFIEYMKSQGKLGGQNKVPRLANDRKIADELGRLICN